MRLRRIIYHFVIAWLTLSPTDLWEAEHYYMAKIKPQIIDNNNFNN